MGNRVKEIMQQKGITIQKLAEQSEVSRRTVQNVLNNETSCTVETLRKLAKALDVSVAELLLTPYEQIVRCDYVVQSKPQKRSEIAEAQCDYSVKSKKERSRRAETKKEDADLLAEAALRCFRVLPVEAQRSFFARYRAEIK